MKRTMFNLIKCFYKDFIKNEKLNIIISDEIIFITTPLYYINIRENLTFLFCFNGQEFKSGKIKTIYDVYKIMIYLKYKEYCDGVKWENI